MKKESSIKWLWGAAIVLTVLFLSSAMTYQQQTTVPLLQRLLAAQPLRGLLSGISFNYAGKPISVAAVGYFGFVEFFVRKAAHLGNYLLLGGFGFAGLRQVVSIGWLRVVLTVSSSAGLAAFDEFHQMLTGGRSPLFQDVMLDTVGAILGVLLVSLWQRRHRR